MCTELCCSQPDNWHFHHKLLCCKHSHIGSSVSLILMSASLQGISDVSCFTSTYWPVIRSNLTVCICSTGSTNFITSKSPAVSKWIASCSSWTPTDGHMVPM